MYRTVITGTGCYIPPFVQTNDDFSRHVFYSKGHAISADSEEIIEKFQKITGIRERRYTTGDLNASDIGAIAAKKALDDSGVNPEEIDQLVVAHNFGDVIKSTVQTATVPSIASLIKHTLGIHNASCVAYDLLFGCPGWIQGVIHADAFFKAGIARKALIIGTETLSRVIDAYDRDSLIFSDGAGAVVLEYLDTGSTRKGLLGSSTHTHSAEEVNFINMGMSSYPGSDPGVRYLKMNGRKVYEFAMTYVPHAMKDCLEKSGVNISDVKKILIHQANEKMDEAITQRFYELYNICKPPKDIMPMSIHWLGNSSVATVPTLLDLLRREQIPGHQLLQDDIILFASVGAGMNINAMCYRY